MSMDLANSVAVGGSVLKVQYDQLLEALQILRGAMICQTADFTGNDSSTAQKMFNESTNGALNVLASTSYLFECISEIRRTAGTTSHTTGLSWGGTATITSMLQSAIVNSVAGGGLGAPNQVHSLSTSTMTITGASISATEHLQIRWNGIIRVDAAGTLIPQFKYSAAPGGAPVVKAGSFMRLIPIGSSSFGKFDDLTYGYATSNEVGYWS